MNTQKINTWLSWAAALLVLAVAIIGFALSYTALRNVALANGYAPWAATLWPLLIDFALVVFSIGVVRAYVWKELSYWPWAMVGVFTLATIVFNLVHAGGDPVLISVFGWRVGLKYLVGVVPPIALLLSFETLMSMVKSAVRRYGTFENIIDLTAKLEELRQRLDKRQGEYDKAIRHKQAELDKLTDNLSAIQVKINDKRRELAVIGQRQIVIAGVNDPTKLSKDERLPIVRDLLINDIPETDIRETLQISARTLDRYKTELNGARQSTNGAG